MNNKPFIVAGKKGVTALKYWLKKNHTSINSYSYSPQEKHTFFSIGYNTDPDSDWGRYTKHGGIILTNDDCFDDVCEVIRKHLGWPKETPDE